MIGFTDLSDYDYQILQKVADNPKIQKSILISSFPEQKTAPFRIDLLLQCDYHHLTDSITRPAENTSYLLEEYTLYEDEYGFPHSKPTGKIEISPLGKKALEEWHLSKKKASRKLWEERLWKFAPLPISLTALAVAIISLLQALHWIQLER